MNGVIIWSEHISKRAIIWCEDHGRLAFFKAEETLQGELSRKNQVFAYESGDMVSFTVDEQADYGSPAIYNGSAVRNIGILPSN